MKSILIITSLMLLTMQSFSQKKYSSQRPYLKDIYEVFDYVHRTMYSDDKDSAKIKLVKIFSNELFINKERKTLNDSGKILLSKLMKIKSLDQGYDFQYCWVPIEKNQTENYFEWNNKNQTKYSSMSIKFEDGTSRLTAINIEMETDAALAKSFYTMSCTQTTVGTVQRGKRNKLDKYIPNTEILAFNEVTNFWQVATFKDMVGDDYLVSFSNQENTKVNQIIPIEISLSDLVYYIKDKEYTRGIITKIDGNNITIGSDANKFIINRNELFYRLNTYNLIDTNSILFSK